MLEVQAVGFTVKPHANVPLLLKEIYFKHITRLFIVGVLSCKLGYFLILSLK